MKQITKIFAIGFMAVAAIFATSSCQKEEINGFKETKSIKVSLATEVTSKVAMDEFTAESVSWKWEEGDKIEAVLNGDNEGESLVAVEINEENPANAQATLTLVDPETEAYKLWIVNSFDYSDAASYHLLEVLENGNALVRIPNVQTERDGSCNVRAAVVYDYQEFTSFPETVNASLKHFSAYGNLKITGIPEGETLSYVYLSADEKNVAGYYELSPDGTFVNSEARGGFDVLKIKSVTGYENIRFAIAPIGKINTLTVKVETSKASYKKVIDLSAKNYSFTAGHVADITVNMTGTKMRDLIPETFDPDKYYMFVTDAGYVLPFNENAPKALKEARKLADMGITADPETGVVTGVVPSVYCIKVTTNEGGTVTFHKTIDGEEYVLWGSDKMSGYTFIPASETPSAANCPQYGAAYVFSKEFTINRDTRYITNASNRAIAPYDYGTANMLVPTFVLTSAAAAKAYTVYEVTPNDSTLGKVVTSVDELDETHAYYIQGMVVGTRVGYTSLLYWENNKDRQVAVYNPSNHKYYDYSFGYVAPRDLTKKTAQWTFVDNGDGTVKIHSLHNPDGYINMNTAGTNFKMLSLNPAAGYTYSFTPSFNNGEIVFSVDATKKNDDGVFEPTGVYRYVGVYQDGTVSDSNPSPKYRNEWRSITNLTTSYLRVIDLGEIPAEPEE